MIFDSIRVILTFLKLERYIRDGSLLLLVVRVAVTVGIVTSPLLEVVVIVFIVTVGEDGRILSIVLHRLDIPIVLAQVFVGASDPGMNQLSARLNHAMSEGHRFEANVEHVEVCTVAVEMGEYVLEVHGVSVIDLLSDRSTSRGVCERSENVPSEVVGNAAHADGLIDENKLDAVEFPEIVRILSPSHCVWLLCGQRGQ